MRGDLAEIQLTGADSLCHALRILAGLHHGVADRPGGAHRQEGVCHQMVNDHVGQRHVHIIDAIDAQQTANRALHRDGGVLVDKALGVVRHLGSGGTRLIDQFKIQAEFAFHIVTSKIS